MKLSVAQRIRTLRHSKKWTQNHVTKKLYISQGAYSQIENGQNHVVVEHVIGLSKMYDVTTDFILLGKVGEVKDNHD